MTMPRKRKQPDPGASTSSKRRKTNDVGDDVAKKTTKRGKARDINYESFTIKRGFPSFCKHEPLNKRIQYFVDQASQLVAEVSIYIRDLYCTNFANNIFPQSAINAEPFFMQLCKHKNQPTIKRHNIANTDYGRLRALHQLATYEVKQNMRNNLATLYETAFNNNLEKHGYRHINKFLFNYQTHILKEDFSSKQKKRDLARKRYGTLQKLTGEENQNPDGTLLAWLVENGYDGVSKMKKKEYWRFLPLFWQIQRINEEKGWKNFAIFPIFKQRLHHIRIDSKQLHELLVDLKLVKGAYNTDEMPALWSQYFKIPTKHINPNDATLTPHRFDGSIATDGVAVSILMKRPQQAPEAPPQPKYRTKRVQLEPHEHPVLPPQPNTAAISNRLANNEYTRICGFDPGRRLMLGGIIKDDEQAPVYCKLKSATYRWLSGNII